MSIGQNQEADEGAELADQQQRLTSGAIRQSTQHGSGNQLAKRVGGNQEAHHGWRSAHLLGIKRKQGQDDGEAQDIDGYDQENGDERRFMQGKVSTMVADGRASIESRWRG